MAIQHTPPPVNESSEKQRMLEGYLDEALRPMAEQIREEHRVTDLLYDAAQKGDRAGFHQVWKEHILPRKVAATPQPSDPPR
jgi:hypothetical protein